jgi:hypothetical protein
VGLRGWQLKRTILVKLKDKIFTQHIKMPNWEAWIERSKVLLRGGGKRLEQGYKIALIKLGNVLKEYL